MGSSFISGLVFGFPVKVNGSTRPIGYHKEPQEIRHVWKQYGYDMEDEDNYYDPDFLYEDFDCPVNVSVFGFAAGKQYHILHLKESTFWTEIYECQEVNTDNVSAEQIQTFKEWCEENEVEWVKPKWWLCSYLTE